MYYKKIPEFEAIMEKRDINYVSITFTMFCK